jgi:transketolase
MSSHAVAAPVLPGSWEAGDLAPDETDIDGQAAAAIRLLAADGVQAAESGHPGLPLGTAMAAWVLWSRYLKHDPSDPEWPDRDRFVLSAGHGSMLLYSLLHLFGYDLPIAELRRFRQWDSKTPGHPEFGHTAGVETTTGPLGQGLANAVGMALAERMLAERCNVGTEPIVNHRTWVIAGDGDLMEGISHEAASLAGHLRLGHLNVIFDDNDITIDGPASQSCSEDVIARFAAYGWHTVRVKDANDPDELATAYEQALAEVDRPSFIAVRTVIGYGAPSVAGTSAAHGAPLGADGLAVLHARFGSSGQPFQVPESVADYCRNLAEVAQSRSSQWRAAWARWQNVNPSLASRWPLDNRAPRPNVEISDPEFKAGSRVATRVASGAFLNHVGPDFPALVGGSADLAASTNTTIKGSVDISTGSFSGRTIHFGIREHAMGAMLNGLALHGGLRPYGSTFLVFSDYMRPSIRLAALMKLPVVFVFTHDSIAVGEDGPTHQPVEHVESLRLIPGLEVLRPADARETSACWQAALERTDGPTALILSRQGLPVLDSVDHESVKSHGFQRILATPKARLVLAASGSEVELVVDAAVRLRNEGVVSEVWSVPSRRRLERAVANGEISLPDVPVIWVEAGVPTGWQALSRDRDAVLGLSRFGASAPGAVVAQQLGLTVEVLHELALSTLHRFEGN